MRPPPSPPSGPRSMIQSACLMTSRWCSMINTVLIIEHHLDVIKQADWIIDLGPEGGEGGGRIVAQGPPELVARTKKSYTGQVLARVLNLNGNAANGRDNGNSGHNK